MRCCASILGLCIVLVLTTGCGSDDGGKTTGKTRYFDLTGFVKEITVDSLMVKVEKRVSIGESDETKELESYDFWRDEVSFEGFDINRPALIEKYTVDTSRQGLNYVEHYLAKDPELRVSELKVSHEDDQVTEIWIKSHSESFLEDMKIELNWKPGESYHYLKISDKIFNDPQEQLVVVRVIP